MDPREFIRRIDAWTLKGGPFPRLPPHDLTTVAEAEAVCRAIASPHIYAPNEFGTLALFDLMGCFQASESREATHHLRDHGLPVLRRILVGALGEGGDDAGRETNERRKAHLFVVKVLAAYQQRGDAPLIVQAVRDHILKDGYLWGTIFSMIAERHPEAVDICGRLADPVPDGEVVIPYLDFANQLSRQGAIARHPFDSVAGLARLSAFLSQSDPEEYGSAISAASSIPFLASEARETLLDLAARHPQPLVRLEAAWAGARLGVDDGRTQLVAFCHDPRFGGRAAAYLDELGLGDRVPTETRQPDFRAMAEMCSWLAHPMEFGLPPDEIVQYDTRELNWPPTGQRHRFWLFRYHYAPRGEATEHAGIGLVGSDTFALANASVNLSPEDVYGLHCCFELRGDPRVPEKLSASAGRKLIAEINPDFPTG